MLISIILRDLWNYKLLILLLMVLLLSTFYAIVVTYENRVLVSKYNHLQEKKELLDTHWRHLLLEEQTLSEHARVEYIAKKELHMYRPHPLEEKVIKVVKDEK